MKKISTKELVHLSLLIALNIVLSRVASIRINIGAVEGIRIGFGDFPTIMAGIMFGPAAGGLVGAIGDMIGYYINPAGVYVPLITFSAALKGMIPSLVLKFTKRPNHSLWQLIIAIAIGQITTSIILTPYFLQLAFNIPFFATLPARIVAQAINVPVYAVLAQRIKKKADIILDYSPR
ncbi:MAG: folate family ECF transporter S component [Thermoanaerobacteraceae bacterium]|nr:folate family ECF transporter S component [Thermoanaerobacteraceae bacterium]